jgi:hypothetical protein
MENTGLGCEMKEREVKQAPFRLGRRRISHSWWLRQLIVILIGGLLVVIQGVLYWCVPSQTRYNRAVTWFVPYVVALRNPTPRGYGKFTVDPTPMLML